jgi:hypothetical protein
LRGRGWREEMNQQPQSSFSRVDPSVYPIHVCIPGGSKSTVRSSLYKAEVQGKQQLSCHSLLDCPLLLKLLHISETGELMPGEHRAVKYCPFFSLFPSDLAINDCLSK